MTAIFLSLIQNFPSYVQDAGRWIYAMCLGCHTEIKFGIILCAVALCLIAFFRTRRILGPLTWFTCAVACAFLGQIYLRESALRAGAALYLAAAALMFCYCALVEGEYGLSEIKVGRWASVVLMMIIVLCAVFVRFYKLGDYPAGLNNDEALFAKYGLNTLHGEEYVGWWAKNSRFMFVYLHALAYFFKLFGASIFTARSLSALVGVLGVVAFFLMADMLFKRAVALIAACSLAFCVCSLGFDRIAHAMNWGTLFACMGIYLLLLAEQKRSILCGIISGLVLGAGVWTYDVYKGALFVIGVFVVYRVIFERGYLRKNWFIILLAAGGFFAATWPMMHEQKEYTIHYMKVLFAYVGKPRKPESVSDTAIVIKNVRSFVKMLFLHMSESVHLQRKGPILNDFLVPLFFLGFVSALYCWKRSNFFLILAWFVLAPVGGILSWPALRRIIIFLPALHLCAALGVFLLLKSVIFGLGLRRNAAFIVSLVVLIVAIFTVNTYIYFNRAEHLYGGHLKELGEYVGGKIGKRFMYLVDVSVDGEVPACDFLTHESRKGKDRRIFYRGIKSDEIYPAIFNTPSRDVVFVFWNNRKSLRILADIEKLLPFVTIERKRYILVCKINGADLEKERGVEAAYRPALHDGHLEQPAVRRAVTTEFDWERHAPPVPYPFRLEMEGLFYVPRDGRYTFHLSGNGETEIRIDGSRLSIPLPGGCYLKAGAHKVSVRHLQDTPGTLTITWGEEGKPGEPIWLWHEVLQKLFVPSEQHIGDIIVVDDEDRGFSVVSGKWGSGFDRNTFGGYCHWSERGTGKDKVQWVFTVPRDGLYEIYAMWSNTGNRATNAPYRISHVDGITVRHVNQRKEGGEWIRLGIYPFAKERKASVTLSDDADGYVIADAVKLEYRGELPPREKKPVPPVKQIPEEPEEGIIADDEDPGFEIVSGTWGHGRERERGCYGDIVHWAPAGGEISEARWTVEIPATGDYEVFARWTQYGNRATNTPYTVQHAGGADTVRVSQRENGGKWNSLGIYRFSGGTPAVVSITNDADRYVIADAVKLVPVEEKHRRTPLGRPLTKDRKEGTVTGGEPRPAKN